MKSFTVAAILSLSVTLSSCSTSTPVIDQEEDTFDQVTRVLTIENVLVTSVTTSSLTNVVYPTCTTAVVGVTRCAGIDSRLTSLDGFIDPSGTLPIATMTENPAGMEEGPTSLFQLAEVVLPSCDCPGASQTGRSPRLMKDAFVTIRSTTTFTAYSVVTSTDTATTVSITYNGCIPFDAPSTKLCQA